MGGWPDHLAVAVASGLSPGLTCGGALPAAKHLGPGCPPWSCNDALDHPGPELDRLPEAKGWRL
jgi:hypothetical protein